MATPRKHWFRVADSVLNEAWTNNDLASIIRLMAYLNTRWARSGLSPDEACTAEIPTAAVMQITGRGRADVARSSLHRLAILTGISVRCSPEVCSIEWPKWADFQELRPRERPGIARESPRPHPHPQTHKKKEEKKEPAAVAAPRSGPSPPRGNGRPKRAPQSAFPEPFPPDLRADLQRWGEKNSFTTAQVDQAIQTVADWAVSNDKTKASWLRTIQGGMRAGWALNQKPGPGGGPPPKQENTRREYLEFGSPAWEKAHGYKQ